MVFRLRGLLARGDVISTVIRAEDMAFVDFNINLVNMSRLIRRHAGLLASYILHFLGLMATKGLTGFPSQPCNLEPIIMSQK
jgi:hypothetical protein